MIKSKKLLWFAIILYASTIILNLPFPHEYPLGEAILHSLDLPARSNGQSGLHYVGIISTVFITTSLILLYKSLNKYQGRAIFITYISAAVIPAMLVTAYQHTFATGIYAVSYDSKFSHCDYEMKDESTLYGKCVLRFENYRKDNIQFHLEFDEKYHYRDGAEIDGVALMNHNAPYVVELRGNENNVVIIESEMDVSNLSHISGGSGKINIIMKDGEKFREFKTH